MINKTKKKLNGTKAKQIVPKYPPQSKIEYKI